MCFFGKRNGKLIYPTLAIGLNHIGDMYFWFNFKQILLFPNFCQFSNAKAYKAFSLRLICGKLTLVISCYFRRMFYLMKVLHWCQFWIKDSWKRDHNAHLHLTQLSIPPLCNAPSPARWQPPEKESLSSVTVSLRSVYGPPQRSAIAGLAWNLITWVNFLTLLISFISFLFLHPSQTISINSGSGSVALRLALSHVLQLPGREIHNCLGSRFCLQTQVSPIQDTVSALSHECFAPLFPIPYVHQRPTSAHLGSVLKHHVFLLRKSIEVVGRSCNLTSTLCFLWLICWKRRKVVD
jgi:hypothetical protein